MILQPIETAPKDVEIILCNSKNEIFAVGKWSESENFWRCNKFHPWKTNLPDLWAPIPKIPKPPKVVSEISASKCYFDCPNCGATLDGWLADPRGRNDVECETCMEVCIVDPDAKVNIS